MPRRTLKQWIPSPAALREQRVLRLLGEWPYAANLWHLNRYSASMAFFVGLFVAYLPVPGQMLLAAGMALLLRCNLPLSLVLVWVTNPVTMPPMYYVAYRIGALALGVPPVSGFEFSWAWLGSSLGLVWQPLLLGSVICGLLFGSLGYFVMNMVWRFWVVRRWRRRKRQRQRIDQS